MIISIKADLTEIDKKGRDYPWKKPDRCPKCGDYKVWGHGFVEVCFDGFKSPLLTKRYRCPNCGCVIRYRPIGFFKRFQAGIDTIRSCISCRIRCGRWPPGLSRSRQGHWLKALKRRTTAYLENTWDLSLIDAFDRLLTLGQIPVSRSI